MENGVHNGEDCPLFDSSLIEKIDWSSHKASFKNGICPTNPGEALILRPLCLGDYEKGFITLLSQLTSVGDVSKELFTERFNSMKACHNTFYVTVLEDRNTGSIIGTATLVVEQKFIHQTALRGRIEDVVVSSDYRGKQLGKLLVEAMTLLGKHLGVYKMSLECMDKNLPFYEVFGYVKDEGNNYMIQRFKD